jgi:threonine/homoserine/homoserine lactone efflux protein
LSYVLISTFTPGLSNISRPSVASLHGYRNKLKYQAGLAAGVSALMLLSGLISATVLSVFPVL